MVLRVHSTVAATRDLLVLSSAPDRGTHNGGFSGASDVSSSGAGKQAGQVAEVCARVALAQATLGDVGLGVGCLCLVSLKKGSGRKLRSSCQGMTSQESQLGLHHLTRGRGECNISILIPIQRNAHRNIDR